MRSFTQAKVRVVPPCGQGRTGVAALVVLALLLMACQAEERRWSVQADTTRTPEGSTEDRSSPGLQEVAVLDPDSSEASAGDVAGAGARTAATPSRQARAGRSRDSGDTAGNPGTADRALEPDAAGQPDRPPPPVLLPSGRILLPPGTVFAVELRTPIHTATTVVGDRFAARLTQDVSAGGRIVFPAGALVEGRVRHVGTASEDGRIAYIQLNPRKVRLTDGRLLRITAAVLDVTGQEVLETQADVGRAGAVTQALGGGELSPAAQEARAAILSGILERVEGRVVVAGSTDREIIIPTGTPFTLQLIEPLEIPAP